MSIDPHQLIKRIADHTGSRPDKFFKTTLFRGDALLLGLNCLDVGQVQAAHAHAEQDKFYLVVAGEGRFTLGESVVSAGKGEVVWAPAGIIHGVANNGPKPLTLLVGIAPAP